MLSKHDASSIISLVTHIAHDILRQQGLFAALCVDFLRNFVDEAENAKYMKQMVTLSYPNYCIVYTVNLSSNGRCQDNLYVSS